MDESQPPDAVPVKRRRVGRRRSLLWVMPERLARRLSWCFVLLVCVVPLLAITGLILSESPRRNEAFLTKLLSERLASPVRLHVPKRDLPGRYRFTDITVEKSAASGAVLLRAPNGTYFVPRTDAPGRLELDNGTLKLDLTAWTEEPTQSVVRMLHNTRENKDLTAVFLSRFVTELSLGEASVTLKKCLGSARLTEEKDIRGHLLGWAADNRMSLKFVLGNGLHKLTVTADPLPWVKELLTPTLGKRLSELLESPRGRLTLSNRLATGSDTDDNWRLRIHTTLDLSHLPEELGRMTGKLDVTVSAFGRLDRPATLRARLALVEDTEAALSPSALRSLHFLLTGRRLAIPEGNEDHRCSAIKVSVIMTHRDIYLTEAAGNDPTGIYGPGKDPLLPLPLGEGIPISDFLRRFNTLKSNWNEAHSS